MGKTRLLLFVGLCALAIRYIVTPLDKRGENNTGWLDKGEEMGWRRGDEEEARPSVTSIL